MDRTNAIEKLYSESLEYLFKQDSTAGMTCSSDSHLAIVYATFLRHAQRYVHILHGSMSILNYEEVLREAQKAIERGIEIKCLVRENSAETTFEKLLSAGNFKADSATKPFSFVVMDDRALCWNPDNRISARVYVNNRKIAKILHTLSKLGPNKFSGDYTAFGMLQFTHLHTITLSKLPYTLRKHFKDFKRCIGFSPLPRITTDVEMMCEYVGYLGKILPKGWTPFKPGSSVIPKQGLKLATVATYGENEYTLMEGRAYCNLAIKTDNLLLPTKEIDRHETKVLATYEVSYELLEYFNKVGVPWQIETGDRSYIRVNIRACGECCQYDIYPEAMRVLGFPYYSPNEYRANSEELHPFLEQLLYSEDEQNTKRLHETAQKHGLKIPEGTVTFKTYIEQILIPMGIEPIEFYRYHEYAPDSLEEESPKVLGVLPSRFRIHTPKLLLGFQGRIELTNLTKQQLQNDRSFIYVPLDSITGIRYDGQQEVIAMTVRGEVLLRSNLIIYPPAFTVKEEFVSPYESYHRGEHHTILVPKDFNDIVPVAGFNFYSDMETFHTSDGTEIIRSSDLDKIKAQSEEINGILQNPCMAKYEVKGNQIDNTKRLYGNGGPKFSRDEFMRLFELNKSSEYLSHEEIFEHPQGLFELFELGKSSEGPLEIIGEPQVIHAWLNHLQEASLIGYEKVLGQTFIRVKDVTYELLISDIVYIAEHIPALYAVIRAMAATTPNLRELAAKALKAYECTRI